MADKDFGRAPRAGVGALLERTDDLSLLGEALAEVRRSSQGRLVLLAGEAGVGKTALLRRFCAEQPPSAGIMWGACDPLLTPRPLGPLLDIAEGTGGELEELLAGGAKPHEVVGALMRALAERTGTIVVLEDMHWADEATLDALRLLGRRIDAVPALIVASYRDDELDRVHPLRIAIGELGGGPAISRLRVEPLSSAAVAELAEPHELDAEALYRVSGGNPFFVTEVLAAGVPALPQTVRDAVLARGARLSERGRRLLEAVAVVPQPVELWLLEALAQDSVDRVEECLASGMLTSGPAAVGFRHELARVAVEDSLPADRRAALHRLALAALLDPPAGGQDLARLAHHADAADDGKSVLRFAPAAGERAASLGAHREAAAQYARALRFADQAPVQERARLLDLCAGEYTLIGRFKNAIELRQQAIECHGELGDTRKQGESLVALSWPLWTVGRTEEALDVAAEAVAVLEPLGNGPELARAYGGMTWLGLMTEDAPRVLTCGKRARELAQLVGDVQTLVQAQTNVAMIELREGADGRLEELERNLALAQQAGLDADVARGFCALARGGMVSFEHPRVERYVASGIQYFDEHDLEAWKPYLIAVRSELELEQGRWGEAGDSAAMVLLKHRAGAASVIALVTLGRLRARRGDPEQWQPLDDALAIVQRSGELWTLASVAVGRAEAAWLEGRDERVDEETHPALGLALERGASQLYGELLYWRRRAGIRDDLAPRVREPYALELAGEWAPAAELWRKLGCRYKAALALSDAEEEEPRREALEQLQALGAAPAAAIVARKLREMGARGIRRGPRARTQENPAGLTARELEVLALLAEGLHNSEIAERLVVSQRTVGHHVSAILRKLDVKSRGEAGAVALRLGLARQHR